MSSSVPEIAAYTGIIITFASLIGKRLIDHYFEQQKQLKSLEAQMLKMTLEKFEYDINGLGSKLRTFEQKNDSLYSTIGKFELHIERLSLKLEGLQQELGDFVRTFDNRVKELIRLEHNHKGI